MGPPGRTVGARTIGCEKFDKRVSQMHKGMVTVTLTPPADDHECGWKKIALELAEKISDLDARLTAIQRQVFGKKSEKMPPMDREVRKKRPVDKAAVLERRRKNAELRASAVKTEDVTHQVSEAQRRCPKCGKTDLGPVGKGKESIEWNYVPGYFRRCRHVRETLACSCGQYIVTAPGPDHSVESTRYGDGLRAYVVTSKCADSLPLYRLAKQFARLGIPIPRSTLTDLFHQVARQLTPLSERLVKLVAASDVVLADETPMKMQHPNRKGYVWTFIADDLIVYRFSGSRSGQTPSSVLGDSTGVLVVDMYTGYNEVTSTGKRQRSGCLAHARRKLFDALAYAPEAQPALDLIRDVYVVEHDARAAGVVRTTEHLRLRQERSRPLMEKLHAHLTEQKPLHLPKGPMSKAIGYILGNWKELTAFLDDVRLPPDNNRSESALRIVTLGRKNFLHVGDEDAGANIAGLYSLVATCSANGKNPLAYLNDVLGRIGSHPNDRLDELLPQNWKPPETPSTAASPGA
jgi:transposase